MKKESGQEDSERSGEFRRRSKMDQHEKERNMGSSAERNERKAADGKSGAGYRTEHDTMGEVLVPADRYWVRRHSAAT